MLEKNGRNPGYIWGTLLEQTAPVHAAYTQGSAGKKGKGKGPAVLRVRNGVLYSAGARQPFGPLFKALVQDKRRGRSLFVMVHRYRNPIACRCCIKKASIWYQNPFKTSDKEQLAGTLLGYPFLEYISLKGLFKGAYGNCLWNSEEGDCDYHMLTVREESDLAKGEHYEVLD